MLTPVGSELSQLIDWTPGPWDALRQLKFFGAAKDQIDTRAPNEFQRFIGITQETSDEYPTIPTDHQDGYFGCTSSDPI